MSEKIVAYKLTRDDAGGTLILGPPVHDIGVAIANELSIHDGLSAEECSTLTLTPFDTTQAEIDALPEFDDWL